MSVGLEAPCPLCHGPVRCRYPGNDPENGPARPYCTLGHSTCYRCGAWFEAIEVTGASFDPEIGHLPAAEFESDWCHDCAEAHRREFCGCGTGPTHHHDWGEGPAACCGGSMCCEGANV